MVLVSTIRPSISVDILQPISEIPLGAHASILNPNPNSNVGFGPKALPDLDLLLGSDLDPIAKLDPIGLHPLTNRKHDLGLSAVSNFAPTANTNLAPDLDFIANPDPIVVANSNTDPIGNINLTLDSSFIPNVDSNLGLNPLPSLLVLDPNHDPSPNFDFLGPDPNCNPGFVPVIPVPSFDPIQLPDAIPESGSLDPSLDPDDPDPDPDPLSSLVPISPASPPHSQSPTATLQSTNTQTQSSSSSSGDGSLFRQRGSQAAQPDETGRVPPYVDFTEFYALWGSEHSDGQSTQGGLGPQ